MSTRHRGRVSHVSELELPSRTSSPLPWCPSPWTLLTSAPRLPSVSLLSHPSFSRYPRHACSRARSEEVGPSSPHPTRTPVDSVRALTTGHSRHSDIHTDGTRDYTGVVDRPAGRVPFSIVQVCTIWILTYLLVPPHVLLSTSDDPFLLTVDE